MTMALPGSYGRHSSHATAPGAEVGKFFGSGLALELLVPEGKPPEPLDDIPPRLEE